MTHRITLKRSAIASFVSLTVSFSLWAEETTLDQLVISASGHEQQITDAPASITVVTKEDLENKPYKDVTDALQDVPGVMITGGGSSQDISLRGLGGKYTLILVDGKRQGSRETRPNGDGPGIEQGWTPPLSVIERIEVIRGPMSSLYGSDALGGVVNIITKKVSDSWGGEVSLSTIVQDNSESGDSQQADVLINGPIIEDKLGLQVYGQISQRDEDNIFNGYAEQEIRNGTAKLAWQIDEKQSLTFEAGKEKQSRATHVGASVDPSGRNASDSDTEYTRDHYAVTHNANFGDVSTNTYLTRESIDNPTRDMYYTDTVLNNQTTILQDSHVLTLGGQYQHQELTDEGNELSNGVNQLTRGQAALFAENEYFATDDLSITTGLRYNEDENYGSNISPRLYSNWTVTPNWALKGGVGTGYRSPDLRQGTDGWGQITGGGGSPSAVILGNSDLEPEESVSSEAGIYWDSHKGSQISATIYRTNYKNKITEQRICDTEAGDASCINGGENYRFISERYNVDKVTIQGIELTAASQVTENLSVSANYTYTDSEQKTGDFAGSPLNRLPKHQANASANWTVTPKLTSWMRINYHGTSSEGLVRTSIEEKIPSYTFVDAGINYKVDEDITVFAGIYNLLDKEVDYDSYDKVLDGRRYHAKVNFAF
ncbi:ligand-gated channel protein [Marinomonas epiphytica]